MEICFCGQNHKNVEMVKENFYKHKCQDCRYEGEKKLWNWIKQSGNISFDHNVQAYWCMDTNGKFLPLEFYAHSIILELEDEGCNHKPHVKLLRDCKYNERRDFHCIHSEIRYKINTILGQRAHMIRFPIEMCSNKNNFIKIQRAIKYINDNKNEYHSIIVLIKNNEDGPRYDYLSDFLLDRQKKIKIIY